MASARTLKKAVIPAAGLGTRFLPACEAIGDEAFAVLLGDDLIDDDDNPAIGQLARVYEQTGAAAIAVMEVPPGEEHKHGVVVGERDATGHLRIREMIEKPKPGTSP